MESIDNITPRVRLSFSTGEYNGDAEVVFGHGVAQLCQGVKDMGSLNRAAKSMGMAYSKAWRIMKHAEASLGHQLLDRDGAHGSTLTPEGELILSSYNELERLLNQYAAEKLHELISQQ